MPRFLAALAAVAALAPATASAHKANPNYLSRVDATPPGVTVEVINRDDQLALRNSSGEDVIVVGYDGEPYARIEADGTVSVNRDSPAAYLNDERFGGVDVPDDADGKGAPRWEEVNRTSRFAWHDHRAHWMGKKRPPQVKDPDKRTKVFDWDVPLRVGSQDAAIAGTLFWTPKPGGDVPVAAIVVGLLVVVGASVVVIVARRRREPRERAEAW